MSEATLLTPERALASDLQSGGREGGRRSSRQEAANAAADQELVVPKAGFEPA